jgi:hypothetical protein
VVVVLESGLVSVEVERPAASLMVDVSVSRNAPLHVTLYVVVRPSAVERVTVVGFKLPWRSMVWNAPSGGVSFVRKPSRSNSN